MKFTHCKSTIYAKLVDLKDQVFICSKIILVECQGNTPKNKWAVMIYISHLGLKDAGDIRLHQKIRS